MANTRQSAKRARQAKKRQLQNQQIKTKTKSALRAVFQSLKADQPTAEQALKFALKTLAKASSKGTIPKKRASRKMSRMAHRAKKVFPNIFDQAAPKA